MLHRSLDLAQLIKDRDFDGIIALIISKAPLLIGAAAIIVAGFFISNLVGKLVIKWLRHKGVDPSIHGFIRTIITFLMKLAFILSALSTLNVDVNSFVAALAAAAVTAGLGLQSSIGQFASGLQILINRPFKSGDFIDIGTAKGRVQEIKMMYTVLITQENTRVIVPNSHITESNIINYNAEKSRKLFLKFSISYDADIGKARNTLVKVANSCDMIFKSPEPRVIVSECASSSVDLVCMLWCKSTDYYEVLYYMEENMKNEFDKNGISIPFDQLDIHIMKEDA